MRLSLAPKQNLDERILGAGSLQRLGLDNASPKCPGGEQQDHHGNHHHAIIQYIQLPMNAFRGCQIIKMEFKMAFAMKGGGPEGVSIALTYSEK